MRDVVGSVRAGFYAALLPRGLVWGLAGATASCALVVLLARVFAFPVPHGALALGVAGGALVGLLFAARGVPSRKACRVLADDFSHAGGLLLVADLPGAQLWPKPDVAEVPLPPRRLKRPLWALAGAFALCLAAAYVPLPQPGASQPVVPLALIDAEEAKIEQLAEEAELSAAELEEVREEVRRIVEAAPDAGAAETVDALDRVAERLRLGAAISQAASRRAAAPRTTYPTAAESAALQQALSETLAQSPASNDITEGQGQCEGSGEGEGGTSGEGAEGNGEGDGEGTGSGAATRGPGAAVISWTDPTGLGASKLKDISREADPTKDESTRIGEALDEWDESTTPAATAAPPRKGGLPARASGTGPAPTRVLPRHRAAVRRYFLTERNEP